MVTNITYLHMTLTYIVKQRNVKGKLFDSRYLPICVFKYKLSFANLTACGKNMHNVIAIWCLINERYEMKVSFLFNV